MKVFQEYQQLIDITIFVEVILNIEAAFVLKKNNSHLESAMMESFRSLFTTAMVRQTGA